MFKSGVLAIGLLLSACLPGPGWGNQPGQAAATVDLELTARSMSGRPVMETAQLAPTTTLVPSATFTAIPSPTAFETPATPGTLSVTLPAESATFLTSTHAPEGPSGSEVLPPGTDYAPLHLENRPNKQIDIILYCTTPQGYDTILEYANFQGLTVRVPQGRYTFIVYVGGVKLTGSFLLITEQKLSLTIYKDRVAIH